jgi:rod shape-determining protein MreD
VNWLAFLVALLAAAALDGGFTAALALGPFRPALVPAILAFVALHGPRRTALWAAFAAGILVDLLQPSIGAAGAPFHVIGPNALGGAFGVTAVLLLRSMVFRRNPLTLGFMTVVVSIGITLVTAAIFAIRRFWSDELPPWGAEPVQPWILRQLVADLVSGLWAIPLAWPLNASLERWDFFSAAHRPWRRAA